MIITLTDGRRVPVEMHRIKTVQKINLIPAAQRLECMREVGYNTFLLPSREVFLDMLTDSGTNAMSDNQMAAMMVADDAYAGFREFLQAGQGGEEDFRFRTHPAGSPGQGRRAPAGQGSAQGAPGRADELPLPVDAGARGNRGFADPGPGGGRGPDPGGQQPLQGEHRPRPSSAGPSKSTARENVAFIRMEATTNLIGGQPFSMQNLRDVNAIARETRHSDGSRRQPDRRERLFHQAARSRVRRRSPSRTSSWR